MRRCYILLVLLLLAGCHRASSTNDVSQPSNELTVSAAVSLKDAFNELASLYTTRTGKKVNFNFGASGVLQKQIEQAAPVDVFASAGARQMDELERLGLLAQGTRQNFARNTLVLIVPGNSALKLQSFADLDNAQVQKLAVGNPQTVPAGQYTQELLTNLKLLPPLQARLVLAEDVRQVLDYVARGEVDAGIVYASDVVLAKEHVRLVAHAPEQLHSPILYPIAVLKDSQQPEAARQFVNLVLSPEGQSILNKYGFLSSK
jgi:molybdate transport system substrate-binding protein